MPPAEMAGIASLILAIGGLLWHTAILFERVRQLRQDLDELTAYTHDLRHKIVESIEEKLNELDHRILAITPRDQWPK